MKMKLNNKGFNLIELLAVTILALIMGIGAVSYNSIIEKSKNKSYTTYENSIKSSAMMYIIDNGVPSGGRISLQQLINDRRIERFTDPNSSSNCITDSYVLVTGNIDDLSYTVCLICPNYQSSDDC